MSTMTRIAAALALSAAIGSAGAQTIEWTAGQLGGGWYTIVTGTSKMIEQKTGMTVKAVPGGGAANPTKVQNGQSQLGMSIDIFAKMALDGTGTYEGKPHPKLMMIGQSLGDTPYHMIRAADQKLEFDQILTSRDVKIGVVKAGATDEIAFRWVMEHYGQTYQTLRSRGYRIIQADYSELASAFKDRQIDYVFFAQGLPGASVVDMSTGRDARLLEFPKKLTDFIYSKYGMGTGKIPAGTYPKYQSGDVTVMSMATTLITSSDVSADVIYRVTKALCESQPDLPKVHASLKDFDCKTAVQVRPIPVHPGALRYYRERGWIQG
jgi:TRAP transporter TAXI family solute receptor